MKISTCFHNSKSVWGSLFALGPPLLQQKSLGDANGARGTHAFGAHHEAFEKYRGKGSRVWGSDFEGFLVVGFKDFGVR